MIKRLQLKLKDVEPIPGSLRGIPSRNEPSEFVEINLAKLYHHYYLDKHEVFLPDPDPAQFEYLPFISNSDDFRFRGDGIGSSVGHKRNTSTEFGQAFCRLMLHDHFNLIYFAHLGPFIGNNLKKGFGNIRLFRTQSGDIPDYICAENTNKFCLAEAKGRYSKIDFDSSSFEEWRNQFERVEFKRFTNSGVYQNTIAVKGYIVATKHATESKPNDSAQIYLEDPYTPGDTVPVEDLESSRNVGERIIKSHYANIAWKMRIPLLSSALENDFTLTNQIQFTLGRWNFALENINHVSFVGGFFYRGNQVPINFNIRNNQLEYYTQNPFALNRPYLTFFGVEIERFRKVVEWAKGGVIDPLLKQPFEFPEFDSAVSILKDGSIICPLDYLTLQGQERF